MANEVDETLTEDSIGNTTFSPSPGAATGPYFIPTGRLGMFLAKFFATKAAPYMAKQSDDGPTPQAALAGDTVQSAEIIAPDNLPVAGAVSRTTLQIPELERSRRNRYRRFDQMDNYPEIGVAFDTYSDDATQKNLRNERWTVLSDSQLVVDEVNNCFREIQLDRDYWDIVRNTCKYGDCFIETILDVNRPKEGLKRIKILNPNYILRVENEYGYLTDFLQEIPESKDWRSFGSVATEMENSKYITLDRNQIVHFRLRTADPAYYPYGKSVAATAMTVFRSLKLMEDAMLIYRLSRAPERRVFYIDIAQLPSTKAEMFIEKVKEKFKKEKFYNPNDGTIDSRYNPLSADEDFFVPTRGNQGTKIETLPGAQNLGDVDDVKYFRDKLLAAMKVPKDYIVEKDKSPERKANLSQLDAKFARVICRVQQQIEIGLEQIARRHLALLGFPASQLKNLRIQLPDPSDVFTKRKMEIDEQKARVVQAVHATQLFSKKSIYKEFYDMTDQQIEKMQEEIEKEREDQQAIEQDQMMQQASIQQAGGAMDAEREQMGADMDAARAEGQAQSDHERNLEIEKTKSNPTKANEEVIARLKSKISRSSPDYLPKLAVLNRILERNT